MKISIDEYRTTMRHADNVEQALNHFGGMECPEICFSHAITDSFNAVLKGTFYEVGTVFFSAEYPVEIVQQYTDDFPIVDVHCVVSIEPADEAIPCGFVDFYGGILVRIMPSGNAYYPGVRITESTVIASDDVIKRRFVLKDEENTLFLPNYED